MGRLINDIKFGFRMLRASPGISTAAVLSLAVGIGLNTTLFSVVNAVLIRPPPVERPDELVEVYSSSPTSLEYCTHSYPDYRYFRDENEVFTGLIGHSMMMANLSQADRSEIVIGEVVTGNYFELLGIEPFIGRSFLPEEDRVPGADSVVVLGHGFWQQNFGGDPDVIGETIKLNGVSYTVIGVAPPEFTGTTVPGLSPELWIPLTMVEKVTLLCMEFIDGTPTGDTRLEQRGRRWMFVKGRLKPGIRLEQAQAQMATLAAQLQKEYPESNKDRGVNLLPAEEVRFHPLLDGVLQPVAGLLMGVVGMVLLIACGNVANMLLARATTRRREIAVRLAIGASRVRLVLQLLTESLLLSVLGGAFGLLIALWVNDLLQTYQPAIPLTLSLDLGIDRTVLLFTLVLSLATTIVFGLAPALGASRPDLSTALKEAPASGRERGVLRLGSLLVVTQVALSLMLLIGAGLLARSLVAAHQVDLGFDPEPLGILSFDLEMNGHGEQQGRALHREILERVRALPGVESATLATRSPLSVLITGENMWVDGHDLTPNMDSPFQVDVTFVGNDYFETIGIPILEGRDFTKSDSMESPRVVIVNEELAHRFWPNQSPIGKRIRVRVWDAPGYEVIGVSGDHKVRTVGENPRPYLHFARSQQYSSYADLLFRSSNPAAELETVRRELSAVNPDLIVVESSTMSDQVALTLFPVRVGTLLLGSFSLLGVLLAAIGLYGLIHYWVTQRTHEIGVRLALGAETGRVQRLILKQGMTLAGMGVLLGLAGAAVVSRLLSRVLYTIHPLDPLSFIAAAVILLGVALVANAVPARKAARVDPMNGLRHE